MSHPEWSYGVTTVPERLNTTFPITLNSLERAGFPNPTIFIDGMHESVVPYNLMDQYRVVTRPYRIRAYGNWVLAAWQLYLESPIANRYAIFQDDFVTYRNLRQYLEKCPIPERGYWNLYTFPFNEGKEGWHYSDQRGMGAVALVFGNKVFRRLLACKHMVDRVEDERRGHRAIDGAVIEALRNQPDKEVYKEFVHTPSLVQHIGTLDDGITSAVGNSQHEKAVSFRGEDFDAMELLCATKNLATS